MDQLEFEKIIIETINSLPEKFGKKLNNVDFVVEDEARAGLADERGIEFQGTLLGLYQGVPLTRRGINYFLVLPDKITLFKHSIEQLGGNNDDKIRKIIQDVVFHEIAHYFGMNEKEVRAWEKQRQLKNNSNK